MHDQLTRLPFKRSVCESGSLGDLPLIHTPHVERQPLLCAASVQPVPSKSVSLLCLLFRLAELSVRASLASVTSGSSRLRTRAWQSSVSAWSSTGFAPKSDGFPPFMSPAAAIELHDCRLRDLTSRSLFASAPRSHVVRRVLWLRRPPELWALLPRSFPSYWVPGVHTTRSVVGTVLVVSQHLSTMSRVADRPVCVTGGAICTGWTLLHVNVPCAEHVVSVWTFMETIPFRDLLR